MPNNVIDLPIVTMTVGRKAVTTAGTQVILLTATVATELIVIKAMPTNTGLIYVGGSSVSSSNGFPLDPGETLILAVDHVHAPVWIDSAVSGESVAYIYGKKRSK